MRVRLLLSVQLLTACSDDKMARNFNLARDAAPETIAATQMPLSAPPSLADRPTRPGAPAPQRDQTQDQSAAGSEGQNALLEAAGPAAPADIRLLVNENACMVSPSPAFVDRLMSWTPPPGYTPLTAPPSKGWFGRLF